LSQNPNCCPSSFDFVQIIAETFRHSNPNFSVYNEQMILMNRDINFGSAAAYKQKEKSQFLFSKSNQ
jgi:hypothetical protein